MNTAAGKTLLNRDGTRNEVAIHAIRSGSGMSNDDVDKAIMNQMMQERMGGVPGADMNREFKDREVSRTLDDRDAKSSGLSRPMPTARPASLR